MKLIIEPVDPQPPRAIYNHHGSGMWVTTEIDGTSHGPWIPPHRPGDPLKGGVVQRVEAAQGSDIRGFEQMDGEFGANDWYWLFWIPGVE